MKRDKTTIASMRATELPASQPGAAGAKTRKTWNVEPRTWNFERRSGSRNLVSFEVQGSKFKVQRLCTESFRPFDCIKSSRNPAWYRSGIWCLGFVWDLDLGIWTFDSRVFDYGYKNLRRMRKRPGAVVQTFPAKRRIPPGAPPVRSQLSTINS